MSIDFAYGQGCEIRVGAMANATTDPVAWHTLEYISGSLSPGRDRRPRPKLGVPLHNPLDDRKQVAGIEMLSGQIVVPCDSRQLGRWLQLGFAAPSVTGAGPLYTHTFNSGEQTARLFALQVRMSANDVRIFRGLTISSIAVDAQGEQVEDFNVTLGLMGLSETRASAFLIGAPAAVPASAEVRRMTQLIDGVAAARINRASFSFDRRVATKAFLSETPVVSEVRPQGGSASGSAEFNAVGRVYDDIEAADSLFASVLRGFGLVANHRVDFAIPLSRFAASPRNIDGPGEINRSWSWNGEQDATTPVARVVLTNDVAAYS